MSLNELIADRRKRWLNARVESLKTETLEVEGTMNVNDISADNITSNSMTTQALTVNGTTVLNGDLFGQDASLNSLNVINNMEVLGDARVIGNIETTSISFDNGTNLLDDYRVTTINTNITANFIDTPVPYQIDVLKIGRLATIYFRELEILDSNMNANVGPLIISVALAPEFKALSNPIQNSIFINDRNNNFVAGQVSAFYNDGLSTLEIQFKPDGQQNFNNGPQSINIDSSSISWIVQP